ncbi:MAG: N-acetylneuraminate synthase family protein [Opitutales bacterium]|nr:N-acetylneuraminate synthase family protein [Opitutales bacterium]
MNNSLLDLLSKKNGRRCFVIAEGCDNHLGNMDVAKEMCLRAKLAGADAIKFQHHLPDEEMLPDVSMSDNFEEPLYEFLKKYALKLDDHAELMRYCEELGIKYMCTPFSYKAAEEMVSIGLDMIKIGSGEMTDIPSLVKMATVLRKPMIVSTGMCTFEEIDRTYAALIETGIPLALTHCVSEYPPVYEDINVGLIPVLRKRYPKALIGHSDHTPDLYTCFAAVTLGAKIVEKHVILDKRQPGPDQSVSIDFQDLKQLVDGIRKIESSSGTEKKIHVREKQIREWAFRSIVSTRRITAGEVIDGEMIWSKRPGTGIPSRFRDEVIGKTAIVDIEENTLLKWEDLN